MTFKDMFNVKALAGAMGLAVALMASSASAGINWGLTTLFEDDDLDFLIEANNEDDGILEVGDILVAILELNDAGGQPITGGELTGISVIEILSIVDITGNGVDDIIFGPATAGFNSVTGLNVVDGGAGEGAMVSFWLGGDDLVIDAGSVLAGNETCQDLATCITQASNGNSWLTVGFGGDADDYWLALDANLDTNIVFDGQLVQEYAAVNTGLSILDNQTGQILVENSLPCGVFCGAGDGMVDWLAGGSVKGGGSGGQNGGEWIGTSDFDMILVRRIPTPGTIALFSLGLLAIGATRRRKA